MRNAFSFWVGLGLLLSLRAAAAPMADNDGFQRRNGQMYILRNGQLRAMTHDSRLPTGVLVTKDGFVVDARGRRTELREGQGCDLKGNLVAVAPTASGSLVLATSMRAPRPAGAQRRPGGVPMMPGGPARYGRGPAERYDMDEDDEKHAEKGWEHRRKEEEKRWERDKKHAEKAYGRNKRWKGKRHKGKKWDD
jgi:hypothetical protein